MPKDQVGEIPGVADAVARAGEAGRARPKLGRSVQGIGKDYFYGFTNVTTWDVADNLTVKNIAAARIFKQLSTTDDFGTFLPVLNVGVPGNQRQWGDNSIQYTEELQLQGKALNDKLSWVVGGFLEYDGPLGDTLLGSDRRGRTILLSFHRTARSQALSPTAFMTCRIMSMGCASPPAIATPGTHVTIGRARAEQR
jgi:hypothetical protein